MPILVEDKKGELVSQAKTGALYSPMNRHRGKNRYERRTKSKLASSVKHFNSIDMDKLFKADILDVNIDVKGETNNYTVRISFTGFLEELHKFMATSSKTTVDRKIISKALSRAFNTYDVYFNCNCNDFKYRHAYHATQKGNIIGDPEDRPIRKDVYHVGGLDAANFNDDRGPACKHIILALKDSSWLIKVSSVIYNYINYMKEHMQREYQKFIYPAIYQEPYPEDNIQLDITDILPEPSETDEGIEISEYQEVVDNDIQMNDGKLSPTTRALIDDAGLSLYKNSDGSYTVKGNRITGTKAIELRKTLDKANKSAQDRFNNMKFKKKLKTDDKDENQYQLNFDELERELS